MVRSVCLKQCLNYNFKKVLFSKFEHHEFNTDYVL